MPSHVHHLPKKRVARMIGMQRIDLRVLSSIKIIDVVPLNGLVEEWQAQTQNQQAYQQQLLAQPTR